MNATPTREAGQYVTWEQKPLILMYHRVADALTDPWGLCVTPQHFDEQLQVLRSVAHPTTLHQLTADLSNENLRSDSVVVTFDDGYSDNLYNAKPLLERHEIPATVFLSTGYLGQQREFWWDELDRLLLQPGNLQENLQLEIAGTLHQWKLGASASYDMTFAREHRNWAVRNTAPSERHSVYLEIWKLLQVATAHDRQQILDQLRACANAEPNARPTPKPLSTAEVAQLADGNLIEIGSHTVSHPLLSTLPFELQSEEILESKTHLEEILESSPTTFAYPYGDYSVEADNILREANFRCACTTKPLPVRPDSDPFQLPRVQVQDLDGDQFANWLGSLQTVS